jgi:predicted HTH transcriptional regulator
LANSFNRSSLKNFRLRIALPPQAFLSEAAACDIYIGLLGDLYGYENEAGISPTEQEYDVATQNNKHRLIFIKSRDTACHVSTRQDKEAAFIAKVEKSVVRKAFSSYEDLRNAIYASLIRFLEEKEYLRLLPFDASFHRTASLKDIDNEKVSLFVHMAQKKRNFPLAAGANTKTVLTHLDLLSEDGKITNSALLLFAKLPQRFFITSEVKCAQFYGNDITKPIPAYQVYRGSVFQLIDQAVDFVMSRINARVGTREKSVQVDVDYELPLEAVREAIVNAVTHRDYTSNGSVQVMLFKNRLEVWNPGYLPLGLTVERLLVPHPSLPPNPLLANPLYLAGYIERMGTGTGDIIAKCLALGLKQPEFIQSEDFKTILWRSEHDGEDVNDSTGSPITETGSPITETGSPIAKIMESDKKWKIMELLIQNPSISTREIAKQFNIQRSNLRKHLDVLKSAGIIERVGGTRGYWKVNIELKVK